MKTRLLPILALIAFQFNSKAQVNDLAITAHPATVCSGQISKISTTGSQIGVNYFLRNENDSIIAGPIEGAGDDLFFNTNPITAEETFNVYGVPSDQSSLKFDGNDDYVNLSANNRAMLNQGSVACWVKTSITGSAQYLISNYDGAVKGYVLYIDANGNAGIGGRNGSTILPQYGTSGSSTTIVNDGEWHYVVGTMEQKIGSGVLWSIYVDGKLEKSALQGTSYFTLATTTNPLLVGTFGGIYFTGSIDEIGLWNVALDSTTVENNFTSCIAGNENGLTGYYNLDEGTATTLTDLSPTALNGNMVGMYPQASWVSQSPSPCLIADNGFEMTQTATVNILSANNFTLTRPASACLGSAVTIHSGVSAIGVDYTLKDSIGNILAGPLAGTGSSLDFTTTAISSLSNYTLTAETKSINNNALSFDGVNDYVSCGTNDRSISNSISVSCWVRSTASGVRQFIMSKYNYSSGYVLYLDASGKASFDGKGAGGSYLSSGASVTVVNDGDWHYITGSIVTGGSGQPKIYVDGVLESYSGITNGASLATGGSANLVIGGYNTEFGNIEVDDVSIWNRELTNYEIQQNEINCLTGSETGLVGLFKFNNGTGITVTDHSSQAMDGILSNMNPNEDWTNSTASNCTSIITGCSLTAVHNHTVQVITIDNTTSLSEGVITANQTGATYRWLDCNNNDAVIPGETGMNYTPTTTGDYACEITLNGCSEITACTYVFNSSVGVDDVQNQSFNVYPNPTSSQITISNLSISEVNIINVSGKVVKTVATNEIDVSDLPSGMYILRIQSNTELLYSRFVKK